MRSIFSVRFLAAMAAVFALLFGLGAYFDLPVSPRSLWPGGEEELASVPTIPNGQRPELIEADEIAIRQIEFVDRVYGARIGADSEVRPTFKVVDHLADSDVELVIDGNRSLFIKQGTPGEDYCGKVLETTGSFCAVVADLLGEGVIWFALVPVSDGSDDVLNIRLPAIDVLENRRARLVNGWELPYDPVLKRSCADDGNPDTPDSFESYRQFREELGDDFSSIYSVRKNGEQSRLSEVECRVTVGWADRSIDDAYLRVEYR